jgi:penicillin-binding protein 1C
MEWFLTGTEPQMSTLTLATSHPRILAPVAGTIIALDPDIPRSLQRIAFQAQVHGSQLRWLLDGAVLGAATEVVLWEPLPGSHTLSLVDEKQRLFDTVGFAVRGSLGTGATE